MNLDKYKNIFPQKVYYCSCLKNTVISCLADEIHCLADICYKISQINKNSFLSKIYFARCDDNKNAVVCCSNHLAMVIVSLKRYDCTESFDKSAASVYYHDETKTYCLGCVKNYLRLAYYSFEHTNFDLPI